ncbi:glucosaminidase domain-containing protein [Paenibacillus sp. IHBB 10380]|uniref:glucosaminidase domain-containing protein n=1 Tax=Paenibacillus sp. IHBB 10380 TaxID=1566358 RepID=UPI000697D8BA|nr:glucosaminidase domain-containing protein [Paenibacillus sp. IHBB 10380]
MQEYVLSGGEIVRLKHYIEHKHHSLDPKQRASILADAVHRIIESRLPSFPDEVKKQVCYELLIKHRDSLVIQADDVLQHCMSLDLSKEDLLSSLVVWVSSRTTFPVQEEMVRNILLRWSQQLLPTVSFQALVQEWDEQGRSVCRELAVASEPFVPLRNKKWFNRRISITIACFFAVVLLCVLIRPLDQQSPAPASYADPINILQPIINDNEEPQPVDGIPTGLKYVSIDTKRLKQYLRDRNSILAEEPYLSEIVEAGKKYDIHPLLLFAITGQEQGFVSKDHKSVKEIANNPFNVFGSWESYNTTIASSANIAAKTVANISSRRPGGSQPIQWLNRTYAEDPNWWKGVTWFFDEMKREIEDESFEWPA